MRLGELIHVFCFFFPFFFASKVGASAILLIIIFLCFRITLEPRYNEVLGTLKITLLYQDSHYIRVKKQRNIKSWDQQNYLVI